MDPCLDDCVMFAKKLKTLNVDVSLDILEGLPHGFLNFTMVILIKILSVMVVAHANLKIGLTTQM